MTKAVLVICEGRHDVVFAQRSLGAHEQCSWLDCTLNELPSPFGAAPPAFREGLIAQRYTRRSLNHANLTEASHPPLPSFESAVRHERTGTVFFMVRAHGQDRSGALLELLSDLDAVLDSGAKLDIDEYAVAFLYDADSEGVAMTLQQFRARYAARFDELAELTPRTWKRSGRTPVGCFIFHAEGQDTGTLEDELGPMVEGAWPEKMNAAK